MYDIHINYTDPNPSSDASSCSASQIPCSLWNLKFQNCVNKCPPLLFILVVSLQHPCIHFSFTSSLRRLLGLLDPAADGTMIL